MWYSTTSTGAGTAGVSSACSPTSGSGPSRTSSTSSIMDSRTQRYFDHHAAQFDSIYHEGQPLQRALNRTFRRAIYERFAITFEQSEPIAGKSVLDIGCGSGRYAVEFAKRGAARVVGVDYAP